MNVKMLKEKLAGRPEGLPMYILSHDGLDLFEVKEAIVGCDGQDIDCLLLTPPGDNRMNDGRYMCSGVEMDFIKRDVRMRRRGYNGQDVDCILLTPPEDERLNEGRCMCFGAALELLKQGARMRRRGWNGRGMWLWLVKKDEYRITSPLSPKNIPVAEVIAGAFMLPWIMMCTTYGDLVPWLASQTDMLAEDWENIDDLSDLDSSCGA